MMCEQFYMICQKHELVLVKIIDRYIRSLLFDFPAFAKLYKISTRKKEAMLLMVTFPFSSALCRQHILLVSPAKFFLPVSSALLHRQV